MSNTSKPQHVRLKKVHEDIIQTYMDKHPEYEKKQDVFRHAVTLLEKEDDIDQIELTAAIKDLKKDSNALKLQMSTLIKFVAELVANKDNSYGLSDANEIKKQLEQEVRKDIQASVTKRQSSQHKNYASNTNNRTEEKQKVEREIVIKEGKEYEVVFDPSGKKMYRLVRKQ